jgi:hypothetical protein
MRCQRVGGGLKINEAKESRLGRRHEIYVAPDTVGIMGVVEVRRS